MPNPSLRSSSRLVAASGLALVLAGPALAFDGLTFRTRGASDEVLSALKGASVLLQAVADEQTDAQDLFASARAEYARLLGALYSEGHYSGTISVLVDGREAAAIAPLDTPDRIDRIEVIVTPGPRFDFSRASIAPLVRGTDLPEGFAPGEPARSGAVIEATGAGIDGWRGAGHAKARVAAQDITADHAERKLSAEVQLDPGPRLRFGNLRIRGEDRMKTRRIAKIAGLPEGTVYSPEELDRAAERLRRTGVFRSVTLTEAETIRAPDLLDVTATVVEEKPRRYSLGAEVASFEGLTLSGYWLHRNLLGGAERLRFDGSIANLGARDSGVDYRLGVTIDRPATFTPDTTLTFATALGHIDDVDEQYDDFEVSIGVSHEFSDTLTGRVAVAYEWSQGNDPRRPFLYRNFSLPVGVIWDTRDSTVNATDGFYVDGEIKPFLGYGTTGSGARLQLDARAYRGFGAKDGIVLAGRLQAGAVYGSNLLETPRDYLFYSGGGGTVRGQPYQSLGVNVLRCFLCDNKTGGAFFLGGSVEARVKVTDRIGVVGFYDYGSVGLQDFLDIDDNWHAGAGLGLRYDTGFGPIRLDIAAPVGGDTGDGVQIYVGLGQAF